jgi:hypothetical protein
MKRQRNVAADDEMLRRAAEVIIADPEHYGGRESLAVRCSQALIRRLEGAKGGKGGDDERLDAAPRR